MHSPLYLHKIINSGTRENLILMDLELKNISYATSSMKKKKKKKWVPLSVLHVWTHTKTQPMPTTHNYKIQPWPTNATTTITCNYKVDYNKCQECQWHQHISTTMLTTITTNNVKSHDNNFSKKKKKRCHSEKQIKNNVTIKEEIFETWKSQKKK